MIRLVLAVVAALFSWSSAPALAASPSAEPCQTYAYDGPHHDEPTPYTACEGGPPNRVGVSAGRRAVGLAPHCASARPRANDSAVAYAYDCTTGLVQVAHVGVVGTELGEKLRPDLLSHQGGGVAANTGARGTSVVDDVLAETAGATQRNLTSSYTLSADEALTAGQRWVGEGYVELGKPGSGVFRSADGLQQFRMDANSLMGNHAPGVPHVHLETYAPGARVPSVNNHIPFLD